MAEYSSLYIKVRIREDKLQQFFLAKPIQVEIDENLRSWWHSREMYHKPALENMPVYRANSNRAVFDELLNDRNLGSMEQYDAASQSWIFISVFYSENYREILPMLALLKTLAGYQEKEEKGLALVYDFYWGGTTVMALLEFSDQQALLKDFTHPGQIESSVMDTVNRALETAVKVLNKQFEDE